MGPNDGWLSLPSAPQKQLPHGSSRRYPVRQPDLHRVCWYLIAPRLQIPVLARLKPPCSPSTSRIHAPAHASQHASSPAQDSPPSRTRLAPPTGLLGPENAVSVMWEGVFRRPDRPVDPVVIAKKNRGPGLSPKPQCCDNAGPVHFAVNSPRAAFLNRTAFPFPAISRIIAAAIVAHGVFPPLFQ